MSKIVQFDTEALNINWEAIFRSIACFGNNERANRIEPVFNVAKGKFLEACNPLGTIRDITTREFEPIYLGDGKNEHPSPLDAIFRKADDLALYVVTLGSGIDQAMGELNRSHEITAAYMLDIIASEVTEIVADGIQRHFRNDLVEKERKPSSSKILRYSPGYCGWHISAQTRIFDYLKPAEIGVSLTDGFLMDPMKSNSGVIVRGPRQIHQFKNTFSFCKNCKTHNCRERIDA